MRKIRKQSRSVALNAADRALGLSMVAEEKTYREKVDPPLTSGDTGRVRMDTQATMSDVARQIQRLRENVTRYLQIQAARVKVIVRSAVLLAVIGIAVGIIGLTAIVVSTVLLFEGISGGIGALLGGHLWAGELITGLLVLGAVVIIGYFQIKNFSKSARKQTLSSFQQHRTGSL